MATIELVVGAIFSNTVSVINPYVRKGVESKNTHLLGFTTFRFLLFNHTLFNPLDSWSRENVVKPMESHC